MKNLFKKGLFLITVMGVTLGAFALPASADDYDYPDPLADSIVNEDM